MAEITPMMRQYLEMKERYPDSILFFRLGDFYEMFNEDAKLVSKELDLTLPTPDRNKPPEERTPMCGVPYHSCESYIARLIAKGYKVAICEQTEDPAAAKGLVKRDIIRVVTPGTVIDSACLDDRRGNFLCGVCELAPYWTMDAIIDDSVEAIRGAKAAGMHTVGVADPYFASTDDEMARTCDRYISSFGEAKSQE